MSKSLNVYFSDYFGISPSILDQYGTVDISLISDLPLFIDPFLLFSSDKPEYVALHDRIIDYLVFLKNKSQSGTIKKGLLTAWFTFPEVKQNWFGYSLNGNRGRGLGKKFAVSLNGSYKGVLRNFGSEKLLQSSHLEKIGLIKSGVGKDNISDFTTNLIKDYLLEYTQAFALAHLPPTHIREFAVEKVYFDYKTETWIPKKYKLPNFAGNYVILTPADILTLDEIWINRNDLNHKIPSIIRSLDNEVLRDQLNNYINRAVAIKTKKIRDKAIAEAIDKILADHPDLLDIYIKMKEDTKEEAKSESLDKVLFVQNLLINQVKDLINLLSENTPFYTTGMYSYEDSYKRILFIKDVIENSGGWHNFYIKGRPISKEENLRTMHHLIWHASILHPDTNVSEDTEATSSAASEYTGDKTLVELKLASNPKLHQSIENQSKKTKSDAKNNIDIKAIIFFDDDQLNKVTEILKEFNLHKDKNIILIDASPKKFTTND